MSIQVSSNHPGIRRAAFILLLTGLTFFAWSQRFVQDDAFISFRYAQNLTEGHGLVYNIGERVEGYTNFLWTLLIAAGMKGGIEPVVFSQSISLMLYPFSLLLLYRIACELLTDRKYALLALILTGTNYTYAAYATGGLETHMQSFLFLLCFRLYLRLKQNPAPFLAFCFSAALGSAFLLRMDSALLIVCILPASILWIGRQPMPLQKRIGYAAVLCLPAFLTAVSWLSWKMAYYGHILPNSFFAKKFVTPPFFAGLYYLALFFCLYGLFVLLIPFAAILKKRAAPPAGFILPLLFTVLWLGYIVKNGGGFMEFRFLAAVIPFFAIFAAWMMQRGLNCSLDRSVLSAFLIGVSLILYPNYDSLGVIVGTIQQLKSQLTTHKWVKSGQTLHRHLPLHSGVRIATTAAGAIPFYSRLETVDMLGLNDAWVAKNGNIKLFKNSLLKRLFGGRPGHLRTASLAYLIERRTHLLIGAPLLVDAEACTAMPIGGFMMSHGYIRADSALFPEKIQMLKIPLDEESALLAVYLHRHPAVEKAIAFHGWKIIEETEPKRS